MTLIEWFRQYENPIIFAVIVLVGLSCFGIGLWLGLNSQEAQVKKLKAENAVLAQTLTHGAVTIGILQVKVELLTNMVRKFMEEREKSKDYNDTALD